MNKLYIGLTLLGGLLYSISYGGSFTNTNPDFTRSKYPGDTLKKGATEFVIPANKAYAEPFVSGRRVGVHIPVGYPEDKGKVSHWTNKERKVVWYLYQKKGDYQLQFDQKVKAKKALNFQLAISATYDSIDFTPQQEKLTWSGKDEFVKTEPLRLKIPETGYYRYELTALDNPKNAVEIKNLIFQSDSKDAQVNQTDYQSSPSVHLAFSSTKPTNKQYSWIYEQIEVVDDPLSTFYMALGFYRGYLGMQTNSKTERRVLFSVWDSKDSENDEDFDSSDAVTLVDRGAHTTTNGFGGEGTGGQSYVKSADWKTGETVSFIMNVFPQDDNSVVLTAWYKLQDEKDWNYIASWRAPKENRYFDGFHSFIENYGFSNGQKRRMAEYFNAFAFEKDSGEWISMNKVSFSHTDGKEGQRVDYEQGVSSLHKDRFYMASGGYTPTIKTNNEISYAEDGPDVDFGPLKERVEKALQNEQDQKNKE